jgi:hypothetical protein
VAVGHWLIHGVKPGDSNLEEKFSLDAVLSAYDGLKDAQHKLERACVATATSRTSVAAMQSCRVGHGVGHGYANSLGSCDGNMDVAFTDGQSEPDALLLGCAHAQVSLSVYKVIRAKLVQSGLMPYYRAVEGSLALVLAEMEFLGLRGMYVHVYSYCAY